jgi:hypothetical protein
MTLACIAGGAAMWGEISRRREEPTMKTILSVLALSLLTSIASAQDAAKEPTDAEVLAKEGVLKKEVKRFVPAGKTRTIWFLGGTQTDCTPWDLTAADAQTTKAPEHGTLEVVRAERAVTYAKDHPQAKCSGKKVYGLDVNYKSRGDYRGIDEAEIFVMWPYGTASQLHFHIDVR